MALADRLQQEQQTTATLEALTSTLPAVEQQLTTLTTAVRELREFETISDQETSKWLDVMDQRLASSITQQSGNMPGDSQRIESVESRLSEIEQTLGVLASALDGREIREATASLQRSTIKLETTTDSVSEHAGEHAEKVRKALNSSGLAIQRTRDEAVKAIEAVSAGAADAVSTRLEEATERADAMIAVAERLQKRLGPAVAGRMALALLPFATVLLMGVSTVWTIVHGYQWVVGMDGALWPQITAGVAMTGVVAGIGFGLLKLAGWVSGVLEGMR